MKKTNKEAIGTSFHSTTIKATVNDLKTILGEPLFSDNDGQDKVNFEWEMETDNGNVFTVYDWKEYRSIDADEPIVWHIGGMDASITEQAKKEIETALKTV
jgi:hypothetical protein